MRFTEREEAVSPVIGVILMVAITVILAAVIAVFVFGLAGDLESGAQKDVRIQSSTNSSGYVEFIVFSGNDIPQLTSITASNGTTNVTVNTPAIGQRIQTPFLKSGEAVIVTGLFNDGISQVLAKT